MSSCSSPWTEPARRMVTAAPAAGVVPSGSKIVPRSTPTFQSSGASSATWTVTSPSVAAAAADTTFETLVPSRTTWRTSRDEAETVDRATRNFPRAPLTIDPARLSTVTPLTALSSLSLTRPRRAAPCPVATRAAHTSAPVEPSFAGSAGSGRIRSERAS